MLKVVFDTVVFVRSLINPRSIWGRVVFQHSSRYRLFVSQPVLVEVLEVLQRPELTRKFRTLDEMDVTHLLDILSQAEAVDVPSVPPVSRDPKDDKFLATAAAAQADYLVSEDEDLLVLKAYQGVRIVKMAVFLSVLEALDEERQ